MSVAILSAVSCKKTETIITIYKWQLGGQWHFNLSSDAMLVSTEIVIFFPYLDTNMQEQLWLVIGPPSTSFSTVIFSIVPSKSGHNINLSGASLHSDIVITASPCHSSSPIVNLFCHHWFDTKWSVGWSDWQWKPFALLARCIVWQWKQPWLLSLPDHTYIYIRK